MGVRQNLVQTSTALVLLASINAHGATSEKECTEVDMGSEFGPSRNQDTASWCYAYAAADLLSYKYKRKISAPDVAFSYDRVAKKPARDQVAGATSFLVKYNKAVGCAEVLEMPFPLRQLQCSRDFILKPTRNEIKARATLALPIENKGGLEAIAVLAAAERGLCPEALIPSEEFEEQIEMKDWDFRLHGKETVRNSIAGLVDQVRLLKARFDDLGEQAFCENKPGIIALKSLFPGLANENLADVLRVVSANELFINLSQRACEGKRIKVQNLGIMTLSARGTRDESEETIKANALTNIHNLLSAREPVSIGGTPDFLIDPSQGSGTYLPRTSV